MMSDRYQSKELKEGSEENRWKYGLMSNNRKRRKSEVKGLVDHNENLLLEVLNSTR